MATSAHPQLPATRSVVVAFGGNALLARGEQPTASNQLHHAREAATAVGRLVKDGWKACITHGNGPQVGLLALQAPKEGLDVLGAESQGEIGYLLEKAIRAELPNHEVACLMTQTIVDPSDPSFHSPTKFIGPMYSKEEADRLAAQKGYTVKQDGSGFRRVVASPQPVKIVEAAAIKALLREGIITICVGGGGVPVAPHQQSGMLEGQEAVIDKDAASATLAVQLGASFFLILTDADAIYDPREWPANKVTVASPITPSALSALGDFPAGSMGPKVAAACRFVEETGNQAGVGRMADALDIVAGRKGTLIEP